MVITIRVPKQIFEDNPLTLSKAREFYLESQFRNYPRQLLVEEDLWSTVGSYYFYDEKNTKLTTELLPDTAEVLVTVEYDPIAIEQKKAAIFKISSTVSELEKQLKDFIRKI